MHATLAAPPPPLLQQRMRSEGEHGGDLSAHVEQAGAEGSPRLRVAVEGDEWEEVVDVVVVLVQERQRQQPRVGVSEQAGNRSRFDRILRARAGVGSMRQVVERKSKKHKG